MTDRVIEGFADGFVKAFGFNPVAAQKTIGEAVGGSDGAPVLRGRVKVSRR